MSALKKLLAFFLVIVTLSAIAATTIVLVQPSLFFYPWHDEESYNTLCQNRAFEEMTIPYEGGTLHGWLRPAEGSEPAPLLLFFGGNGQNASNTCAVFEKSNRYSYFEGYHFMMVDYPGYGLSEGQPSEESMFAAALAAYDYASDLERVESSRMVVLGYSIGSGVACYVASQREVNGLILLAAYDRGLSLYNDTLNIFHGPIAYLARYRFDSVSYAAKVKTTPLILGSYEDEVIDYRLSLKLAEHFPQTAQTMILDGITHDGYLLDTRVFEQIQNYLSER